MFKSSPEPAFEWLRLYVEDGDEAWTRQLEDALCQGARRARHVVLKRDGSGWTLLHYAAYYGASEWVAMLLRGGADVHATTPGRYTALHWAVKQRHERCARLLLQWNADVTQINVFGERPLDDCEDEWRDMLAGAEESDQSVMVRGRMLRWFKIGTGKAQQVLANQLLQLVARFFLCLLLELMMTELKPALVLALSLIPRNLPWAVLQGVLQTLFPRSVAAWVLSYVDVLLQPLSEALSFMWRPFGVLVQFYLMPLLQAWLAYAAVFWRPLWSALYPLLNLRVGFAMLWQRSALLTSALMRFLRLQWVVDAALQMLSAIASTIYEAFLGSSALSVVGKVSLKLRPIIQQQLEYRNIISKLVYPLINAVGQLQAYVLPAWFLSLVEKAIRPLFGNALNAIDVALAMVVAVIFSVEASVVILGYVFKGLQVLACLALAGDAVTSGGPLDATGTCPAPLHSAAWRLLASAAGAGAHVISPTSHRLDEDDASLLDLAYMDGFFSCAVSFSWMPDLFHHQLGMLLVLTAIILSGVVSLSGSIMFALRRRKNPLSPLRGVLSAGSLLSPRQSSPKIKAPVVSSPAFLSSPLASPVLMSPTQPASDEHPPARAVRRSSRLRRRPIIHLPEEGADRTN